MSTPFETNFVFIIDKDNNAHFVQNYYSAKWDDCYHKSIFLGNKHYSVDDLFLTDEVKKEGEYLPTVGEGEWREFFSTGPSENAATIIAEGELADIAISKLVFVSIDYSSRSIAHCSGFVSTVDGVQDFDEDFLAQAISFARTKTGSIAKQTDIIADWIVEQVQTGNYTFTK